jgi:proteasome accessory factor A
VNDFFEWVQANRAIVNTRDKPLADPNRFRRIHLLLGDSNMAEVATALKVGTTSLVLQLIEEGHAPKGLDLEDSVSALKMVSRDPSREWLVTLESGKTLSAIDVQERYLEAARRHCKGQDEETDWVLTEWESVLADLSGDYARLVGRVDWASKLWLLETFREAEKLEWDDPWLKSLDMEYHNLNAGRGLYFGLLEEGRVRRVTTDSAVDLAQHNPPRNTRAFGRGELVRHLIERPPTALSLLAKEHAFPSYVINWSVFQLRGHPPFPMQDPFKTYAQEVRQHLAVLT